MTHQPLPVQGLDVRRLAAQLLRSCMERRITVDDAMLPLLDGKERKNTLVGGASLNRQAMALARGTDVDQPRNLAKSVTVE